MASASRKSEALLVERTQFGYVQRARFAHPDLHHEEVLELDSPFAAVVAAGTHVFSFVLLGDQNAGKSTFLHSFSYTDEPQWLELSSYLPLLSSAFLNVRLLPPGDDTPPLDELPYLDTDIGRSNFLMTAENFLFFLREFGLAPDGDTHGTEASRLLGECLGDTRYVLTQFIEVGGDHLDRLIARANPTSCTPDYGESHPSPGWLDDTLNMSERLLKGVGRGAYYINAATLFQSATAPAGKGGDGSSATHRVVINVRALRLLLDRMAYLSHTAPSAGLELLVLVSRLPPIEEIAAPIFNSAQSVELINAALIDLGLHQALGRGLVAADFVFHAATDLNNLPEMDEDVELNLEVQDHPLVHFVRQLLKVVHHALGWNLVITQVLPATHHHVWAGSRASSPAGECITQMEMSKSAPDTGLLTMSVSGLIGTLVRLFNGGLMDRRSRHPDSLVAAHILGCWQDVGRRMRKSSSTLNEVATFNPYVTASDFRDYLLDDEVEDQLELPATTILQRFEPVSQHLVSAGLCLAHAGRGHARLTVRFWYEPRKQNVEHDPAVDCTLGISRHPVGEWHTWSDSADLSADFGVRFPYHHLFMGAIRGHFDREVPTELWLHADKDGGHRQHSSTAPYTADTFAGVRVQLEEARSSLDTEAHRLTKAFIQQLQAGMGERVETPPSQIESSSHVSCILELAEQLSFHLEELALLTKGLKGNSSFPCVRVVGGQQAVASLSTLPWLTQADCSTNAAVEPFQPDGNTDDILVDIVLMEESCVDEQATIPARPNK